MTSLVIEYSEPTKRRLGDAGFYISEQRGEEAATQFFARVEEEFNKAGERIAEEIEGNEFGTPNHLPDEAASKVYFKPIYRLSIETSKRRRGSSTGLYFAYYTLEDRAGKGKPDTMQIVTFRHSAARPIEQDSDDEQ